jgi:hypothetical protein
MKLPRFDSVVLTMLAIVIGALGVTVVYFVGLFCLMIVSLSCRGAKVLNYFHLTDQAGVHCACDSGPKPNCYP